MTGAAAETPGVLGRAEKWARQHPVSIGGVRTSLLAVRVVQGFMAARVMGLSAEMAYYAVLSVFPLLGALGVSLGFLEGIIGLEAVDQLESAIIVSLRAVFSAAVMSDVVTPMVEGLLRQERAGFAVGSFLVTLLLASRVFRSAIDTLDVAYRVDERRGVIALWSLGFAFSLGAVLTAITVLTMVVIGPLLGGGQALAEWFGLGGAYQVAWTIARWPVVFIVAIAFLATLYRIGPNVRNSWRQSLPGAVFGVTALVLVAIGFRVYLATIGIGAPEFREAEAAVGIAGQVIGAILAALLWLWLSAMAILSGGVFNAELSRLQLDMPEQKV